MSKNTLLVTAIWCALAALIFYLADNIQNPNKLDNMGKSSHVVLKRGLDGHYRAQALINGEEVAVLVDTLDLDGFNDSPEKCGEKILEAIQLAWIEEAE